MDSTGILEMERDSRSYAVARGKHLFHLTEKGKENIKMSQVTTYDAIVIGTSQGGRFLPIALAKAGRNVAVIERGHIGGACVNLPIRPWRKGSMRCL